MELKAKDAVPQTYLDWFKADLRHAEEWRKEAKTDYEFRDGKQYTDEEEAMLESQGRPPIIFNGICSIIDAVSGQEISSRQEVQYIPREPNDQVPTELLTSASKWFRDRADADDNDSEAFRDTLTAGMGWTETRLDYEDNPDGDLRDDRLDPFEMVWDYNARKNNIIDANRVWRVRRLPIEEARAFAESMGVTGFSDDDLNADWAASAVWEGTGPHISTPVRDRTRANANGTGDLDEAVIVHCQWIEREPVWRVPVPGGEGKDFNAEEYEAFKAKWPEMMGTPFDEAALGVRKRKRKVRYQAYLGSVVLKVMPTACPDHFNFKCITGKRDQIKGQFYGLVRVMRDPQAWSNKLYSQILHIINSSAKGGIIAEHGAFDDDTQAEESWARNDRITWAKNGAISGERPKWAEKPVAQIPPALQYLMQVAGDSIRKVSGVNLELLGQREADQAGVLEYQRRQAGLTILQPLFDNLKAYRREQGELILWYIQNDLSDGRKIRIIGKEDAPGIPLMKEATLEYDIIVSDAPTSPNQKEKNWQMITQMLPVIKDMLTPDVMLTLAEDSPLPTRIIKKLQKLTEQAAQGPMAQLEQRMKVLEAQVLESKDALQKAQANKANADAQAAMQGDGTDPQAEMALKQQESAGKLQLKGAETAANIQLQREKAAAEIGLQREKQAGDMALQENAAFADQQLKAQQAASDLGLRASTASADIAIKDRTAKAAANRKPAKPK